VASTSMIRPPLVPRLPARCIGDPSAALGEARWNTRSSGTRWVRDPCGIHEHDTSAACATPPSAMHRGPLGCARGGTPGVSSRGVLCRGIAWRIPATLHPHHKCHSEAGGRGIPMMLRRLAWRIPATLQPPVPGTVSGTPPLSLRGARKATWQSPSPIEGQS
jgi:hypothetical protein